MVSSSKFLAKCSKLQELDIKFEFGQGSLIARGFADLGYEEFIMLTCTKICSLYSGKVSVLPEDDRNNFFYVPDCDEMSDKLIQLGFTIAAIDYQEQRIWKITLNKHDGTDAVQYEADSLKDALIECLLLARQ